MRALSLLEGASYDPGQLKILRAAFDAAWKQIGRTVSTSNEGIEAARLKLANAVLTVAGTGEFTEERILADALAIMHAPPQELGFPPSR